MKEKKYIIILVFILFLAAFLRFYNIKNKGFYFDDEAVYALEAKSRVHLPQTVYHHFKDGISFREAREKYMPWGFWKDTNARPGYILLAAASFLIGGSHDYSIFILNGILSLLALVFTYLTVSLLMDKKAGLAAAFLLGVSPYFLYYARNGRSQASTALFLTAGIYFIIKSLKTAEYENQNAGKKSSFLFFAGGFLIGYSFTTHYSLAVSIAAIFLSFFVFMANKTFDFKRSKTFFLKFISGFSIPVLFFQLTSVFQDALLFYFVRDTQTLSNYFSRLLSFFTDLSRSGVYGGFQPFFYLEVFLLMDGAIPLLLFFAGVFFIFYKKFYKNSGFILLFLVTVLSFILISLSKVRTARTLATFLPFVYFFIVFAIWRLADFIEDRKIKSVFISAFVLLISLNTLGNNILLLKFGNPYKEAVEIARNYAPDDKILISDYSSAPIFYFYADKILKGAPTIEDAKAKGGKVMVSDWLLWEDVASDRNYFRRVNPTVSVYDSFLEALINPLEVDRWVYYYGSGIEDFLTVKTYPQFNAANIYVF